MPHTIKSAIALGALALSAYSLNAQATLTTFTNQGATLVYSSESDVTWAQNANLLGSMWVSDSDLISKIISANVGVSIDGYTVRTSDFELLDPNSRLYQTLGIAGRGLATWWGANAFVNYLNTISYGGSQGWHLPTFTTYYQYNTPSNGATAGNELSELFYQELGYLATQKNTSPLFNDPKSSFWSGSVYPLITSHAFDFSSVGGIQSETVKLSLRSIWVITSGNLSSVSVTPVPEPAAGWLFAAGLPFLAAFARDRKQSA